MNNKDNLIKGAKVLGLIVWGMAVIATCAAVWNAAEAAIICAASIVTLVTSGIHVYKTAKKWFA